LVDSIITPNEVDSMKSKELLDFTQQLASIFKCI
jgi:hypothetical protein